MISVHTSPLDQPGTGDAGGMNVYIAETARRLAERGAEVEVFTRATSGEQAAAGARWPPACSSTTWSPVRSRACRRRTCRASCAPSPPASCAREAARREGWYDLIHSHYWLSGQVGWLAKERWGVPLVHTMHTMAKVKNRSLAPGDDPEPELRVIGEQQVVDAADRLIANTDDERRDLVSLYDADPDLVDVVLPGGRPDRLPRRRPRRGPRRPGLSARRSGGALRRPDPAAEGP